MKRFLLLLLIILSVAPVSAQTKKPMDHDVFDIWNRIRARNISHDGNWIFLSVGAADKDTELRVKSLQSDSVYVIPRGESVNFTNDSQYILTLIKAFKDTVKQAKRDKKKPEEMPKDTLGIVTLKTGDVTKMGRVKSYKQPGESGGWVAYLLEKSVAEKDSTDAKKKKEEKKEKKEPEKSGESAKPEAKPETTPAGETKKPETPKAQPGQAAKQKEESQKAEAEKKKDEKKDKKRKKAEGTELVLRNVRAGSETRYQNVVSYDFSQNGDWLIYTAASKDSTADGIYAIRTSTLDSIAILIGPGDYKQTVVDSAGTQIAFVTNRDSFDADQQSYTLWHWRTKDKAPKQLAKEGTPGIPNGWWVGEHGGLSFSQNGKRLFFGTAPKPEPEPDEDETPDDEKVKVDIWNWKDPFIQPMQLKDVKEERERTYQAVVQLSNRKIVQLATETIPDVRLGDRGNADVALGLSIMPYRQLISWDSPPYYDSYLIDLKTGAPTRMLTKQQTRPNLSPEAKYLYWWDGNARTYFVQSVKSDNRVNVGAGIPHPLFNELHDWPRNPSPHGNAGWTEGDQTFLIYDRYDIWATDPEGKKPPINITEGVGRNTDTRFRYVRVNRDERARSPKSDWLLSAFNLETKAQGFYRDRLNGEVPKEIITRDKRLSNPLKAKNADVFLFTQSTFEEYPDLWITDPDFKNPRKVSNVNPQQKDYLWGTAELVHWTSLDGKPLKGILYKPENFDPTKQYPMIVFFYEKMSDQLHVHRIPSTSGANINFAFYVSRGYLVFIPDIPYKVGFPGESAINAIIPGITHLIDRGYVARNRIGVQGHSWGGYQVAHLVTRTNIFRAAEAGAPVSNMISAYGGIRWRSGLSRMMQYEKTQSRIGGSLWETPLRFIENSPIFWADKIETPLLMLHNDNDGAVPWYQGIELFVALRRLHKPVWMINYNGEEHGVRKRHNQKDWTIRLQQFFDHYLKDAPAPVWMAEGVPAIEKGKNYGLKLIEPHIHKGASQ